MAKMPYAEWLAMVSDPDASQEEILTFSTIVPGEGGFDFRILPDTSKVDVPDRVVELENAMAIGNAAYRFRREARLAALLATGDQRPLLVEEGDSWHQFPLIVDEVIDHLQKDFLVASLSAAGDTLANMAGLGGPFDHGGREYLGTLMKHRGRVTAFLFSAAGNDIIGESRQLDGSMVQALKLILRKPSVANPGILDAIDMDEVNNRLTLIRNGYEKVIQTVRAVPEFTTLPILVHGYDYPFAYPYPDKEHDPRDPRHAKKDQWLGSAFAHHKINDPEFRRDILKFLIDRLYGTLGTIAKGQANNVWLVDCRGAMPKVKDWIDEIHGTSKGFAKVATRYRNTLKKAGVLTS